jgi:RNA polymerase sigma-70 factor (ECF subfamily)
MADDQVLAERFQEHRGHLKAVAYRMLGSLGEADDAIQEAWLRASKADHGTVENYGGWLTTIVSRICLNMLTSRKARREDSMDDVRVPDPVVTVDKGTDPEHEAVLADEVGLAMLIVLDTLPPAERLAFVLHDMFAVSFDDIAPILDKSPAAGRQLASRARKRVQSASSGTETDPTRHREAVNAFKAASRAGDFAALLKVLDPDIVLRVDYGAAGVSSLIRGAELVARQALTFRKYAEFGQEVRINGFLGRLTVVDGKPFSLLSYTVRDGLVVEIDIIADPERLGQLDIPLVV